MNVRDDDLSRDELLALVKALRERLDGSDRYIRELRNEIDKIAKHTTRAMVGTVAVAGEISADHARPRVLEVTLNPIGRRAVFQCSPQHYGPQVWEETIKQLSYEIALAATGELGRFEKWPA